MLQDTLLQIPILVLDPTDMYAMHIYKEWDRLHIHIFWVPEIGLTLLFVHIQATGNITEYFEPTIMEPRLLVFTDNEQLSQMFICAGNQELFKGPGERLVEELLHLIMQTNTLQTFY